MRVVLAVPNRDLRLALELYLAEEPGVFLIGVATDAAGTRGLLRSTSPDLLIMSWDLPDCEPGCLVEEARAAETVPCVVALCADEVARADALRTGATAAISSWDPPAALSQAVRQARCLVRHRPLP